MPQTTYAFAEFAAMNGEYLPHNGFWIFANGARSDGDRSHFGPPTDPKDLAKRRLLFLRVKLARAIDDYNHVRGNVAQAIQSNALGAGPPPNDGWEDYLQRQAAVIEQLQTKVTELESQFPDPIRDSQRRAAQERADRLARSNEDARRLQEMPSFARPKV